MRKQLTVLIAALFLALVLGAQEGGNPIVVVSTKGAVLYSSPSIKKKTPVKPGAALVPEGKLSLAAGASALLCHRGQFQSISKKGTVALANIFDAESEPGIDFDADFAKFVEASVGMVIEQRQKNGWGARITQNGDGFGTGVTNPEKGRDGAGTGVTNPEKGRDGAGTGVTNPEKGRDGAGTGVTNPEKGRDGAGAGVTNPEKGRDGWGGRGNGIIPILPFDKTLPKNTTFFWSKPAGVTSYRLDISDDKGSIVHTVTSVDTFVVVNLDSTKFQPGRKYFWTAAAVNKPEVVSDPLEINIAGAAEMVKTLAQATDSQIRSEADVIVLNMMNAVALEQNNWYTEAALAYAALSKKHPQNNMVRLLHATFWMRLLLPAKAKVLLNGK
ncbi:MAG: hypothetical protein JNJ90_13430 [Saprospiraceae bacterium]|nr:hypothetical protein [Saprospiraceae bacterium]